MYQNGTCWIEVDLDALRRNFRKVVQSTSPGTPILAVVKANAYGHGAVPVSRALLEEGADMLGVATVAEGRELREAGVGNQAQTRIVTLGRTVASELDAALRWHLEVTIPHMELAEVLAQKASLKGTRVKVHLKVDTGMTRLGVPWETAHEDAARIMNMEGLELSGIFTHFANADLADEDVTVRQVNRFEKVRENLRDAGLPDRVFHLANSAAILTDRYPEGSGVRPGIMLYGSPPSPNLSDGGLEPVLSWKCRVLQVREVPEGTGISYGHDHVTKAPSRIATISVGYADGFMRCLTNRGQVLISGSRAPVVGRVCMDMTMVDITGIDGVRPGDEVVLIGRQESEAVTAEEMAGLANTISYEIYCGISNRVPRLYNGK